MIRKITAWIASVAMGISLFAGFAPAGEVKAAGDINGHSYLCESSAYKLYLNEEDLSLVIEDKKSGSYMESSISYDDGLNNATWMGAMRSAVVVTIINGNDDTQQADLVNDNVEKKIKKTENGFTAELFWKTYQFGMTLEVSLTEDGLVARIPDESIKENPDKCMIGTISLYPYMGTSYNDDKEGYIFIPDGNGALIYLDDKEGRLSSGYSAMIYGEDVGFDESDVSSLLWDRYDVINDAERVIAPIFGIAHTDDRIAYLGIVEEGATRASIEAAPNGVSVNYNRAYAKFTERRIYTQPTSNNSTSGSVRMTESDRTHADLQVRYLFLTGDKANYSGMANQYREYLLKNGCLTKTDMDYNTRVDFLGTERENWVFGTSSVVMTTTDDIRDIYADLSAEGLTELLSVYKGWQSGGLYNIPISTYKADSKIGGTKDLTRLIEEAAAQGIDLYLYNDALTINPDEQNATFNVVKKINKRRYEKKTYKDVYETMLYLTPSRSQELLKKFVKSYTKQGVNNLALAGITENMFTYTYSGSTYGRQSVADVYRETVEEISSQTNLVMEQPFVYLWKDTGAFLDMPLYTSSYILEDESVPFLSIVLSGVMPVYSEYVNFEANKKEFFLKMVETGTYPSFYITKESSAELIYTNSSDIYSSQYSVYKKQILEYSRELKALSEKTKGASIEMHEILGGGVTRVTYSNGTKVYVNYGAKAQTVDGVTIDAMSYEVK